MGVQAAGIDQTWPLKEVKKNVSMSITLRAQGDVDRLPHKDLLERIVHAINGIVCEECAKRGYAATGTAGQTKRVERRALLGSDPYVAFEHEGEAEADWSVHLEALPEVAERS